MGCAIVIIGALILFIAIGAVPGFLKAFFFFFIILVGIYALLYYIYEKIIEWIVNKIK